MTKNDINQDLRSILSKMPKATHGETLTLNKNSKLIWEKLNKKELKEEGCGLESMEIFSIL